MQSKLQTFTDPYVRSQISYNVKKNGWQYTYTLDAHVKPAELRNYSKFTPQIDMH